MSERRGHGIVLTELGRYFAARARAILEHVAKVLADSKRWPGRSRTDGVWHLVGPASSTAREK